ncbi:MAG: hypothetical protein L0338_39705 [Acidobacteria bacterium]|nr:hypothetical protein [Acidobacteriota bacterium]
MLTPSEISDLKQKDQDLFDLFRTFQEAVNRVGLQMGIDPKPASQVEAALALPPPRAPKSIRVTVVSQAIFIELEASPDATASAFYFVEKGNSPTFQQITTYTLGHALQMSIPQPGGTTYWRAYAKYQMSGKSLYTVFGTGGAAGGGSGGGVATPVEGLDPLTILAQ